MPPRDSTQFVAGRGEGAARGAAGTLHLAELDLPRAPRALERGERFALARVVLPPRFAVVLRAVAFLRLALLVFPFLEVVVLVLLLVLVRRAVLLPRALTPAEVRLGVDLVLAADVRFFILDGITSFKKPVLLSPKLSPHKECFRPARVPGMRLQDAPISVAPPAHGQAWN